MSLVSPRLAILLAESALFFLTGLACVWMGYSLLRAPEGVQGAARTDAIPLVIVGVIVTALSLWLGIIPAVASLGAR
jgi:hypothetical protein